jgi:hypothetical protein
MSIEDVKKTIQIRPDRNPREHNSICPLTTRFIYDAPLGVLVFILITEYPMSLEDMASQENCMCGLEPLQVHGRVSVSGSRYLGDGCEYHDGGCYYGSYDDHEVLRMYQNLIHTGEEQLWRDLEAVYIEFFGDVYTPPEHSKNTKIQRALEL